ncbi:MAG: HAMP domain-containing protein, partial [Segniliparus sp.]|uniref:HAMP domain-containing protein n=1 Tax=Segniliparus sp. TaxID=2804064 RepID=UPI003F2E5CB2
MTGSDDQHARAEAARHVVDETHPPTILPDDAHHHHASHLKQNRLHQWWEACVRRMLFSRRHSRSLQAQVALSAAIGIFIIVTMIAIPLWTLIEDFNFNQADTRLQRLTTVVQGPAIRRQFPDANLDPNLNFTVRTSGLNLVRGISLPDLPVGNTPVTALVDGRLYRVYTVNVGLGDQIKLSVAEPLDPTLKRIDDQHRVIVGVGFAAVVAGGVLGWLLGGFAVRPLRELADSTNQIASSGGVGEPPHVTGAREVEAIAEAMRAMLSRIGEERATSDAALATARDFALLSA